MIPADFQNLTPNELDSLWLEKNWPDIQYYYETRILFGKRFGARIRDVVCGHNSDCGLSKRELENCKPLIGDVRVAEERVYSALKQWSAKGVEPPNMCDLVTARNKAVARIAFVYRLKKLPDPDKAMEIPVVRALYKYPTNVTAMRVLAREMDAVADAIP